MKSTSIRKVAALIALSAITASAVVIPMAGYKCMELKDDHWGCPANGSTKATCEADEDCLTVLRDAKSKRCVFTGNQNDTCAYTVELLPPGIRGTMYRLSCKHRGLYTPTCTCRDPEEGEQGTVFYETWQCAL